MKSMERVFIATKEKAMKVFSAIIEIWHNKPVKEVFEKYKNEVKGLPGYDLEYILYTLKWILEQGDINFEENPKRSEDKQKEITKSPKIYFQDSGLRNFSVKDFRILEEKSRFENRF